MKELKIVTNAGIDYVFTPIPMPRMPSEDPAAWLKFQKLHVPGSSLCEAEQVRIQSYMKLHKTEALTDGVNYYTLAGGMLAYCTPSAVV